MTYATQDNMIKAFGEDELVQLTDRADPPAGVIDAVVLTAALDAADALIDGYVGARYPLPLSSVPPLLTNLANDIARYQLHDDHATEAVAERYKEAVRTLNAISAGRVSLPLSDGSEPTPETSHDVLISAPAPTFTGSSMDKFG